jgi:hypothetical protein
MHIKIKIKFVSKPFRRERFFLSFSIFFTATRRGFQTAMKPVSGCRGRPLHLVTGHHMVLVLGASLDAGTRKFEYLGFQRPPK